MNSTRVTHSSFGLENGYRPYSSILRRKLFVDVLFVRVAGRNGSEISRFVDNVVAEVSEVSPNSPLHISTIRLSGQRCDPCKHGIYHQQSKYISSMRLPTLFFLGLPCTRPSSLQRSMRSTKNQGPKTHHPKNSVGVTTKGWTDGYRFPGLRVSLATLRNWRDPPEKPDPSWVLDLMGHYRPTNRPQAIGSALYLSLRLIPKPRRNCSAYVIDRMDHRSSLAQAAFECDKNMNLASLIRPPVGHLLIATPGPPSIDQCTPMLPVTTL